MPTVKVDFDDETYQRLVVERKSEGLPSVQALLLKRAGALTEDAEADEIIRQAVRKAKRREGEFSLKQLFLAASWDRFSKGARLRAGRRFYNRVAAATDGIAIGRKGPSGHQMYFVQANAA